MNLHPQRGFTLWELLMTLLVAGILLGIGVPNVMEFQRNGAMTAAANDLVTAVLVARTEAVKRQAPVGLCLTDDALDPTPTCASGAIGNSTRGFVVWVDENNDFNADGSRDLADATDGNGVIDNNELILTRTVPPGGSVRLSANCGHLSFRPTGFTRNDFAGLCNVTPRIFLFCDDRGRRVAAGSLSAARAIRVAAPGRSEMVQEVADIATLIAGPLTAVAPTCP
jgi:prepilin-type N-terminal cleavage/methylation domain-containing protein